MVNFFHFSDEAGKHVQCDAYEKSCHVKSEHISENDLTHLMPNTITTVAHVFSEIEQRIASSKLASLNDVTADMDGLCESDYPNIRATAASSPMVSASRLRQLSHDAERIVREEVARNMITDPKTLHMLADDPSWRVRYNVANNFIANKSSLHLLATDDNIQIREQVADNFNTAPETLTMMVEHENEDDVLAILAKRKLPSDELYHDLKDRGSFSVKANLAINSYTPVGILEELQMDGFLLGSSNSSKLNQNVHS